MRLLDQQAMNRLFDVTDEIPIDRESITVPLAMEGDGAVEVDPQGHLTITLPDQEDLQPFLDALPARLRELGLG